MNTTTTKSISSAPREAASTFVAGVSDSSKSLSLERTWMILRFTFGLVPIVAGLDKFTNILVNWETYLNPLVLNVIPLDGQVFMGIVGVIEIAAGILVLARPRIGGFVVMAWLVCIALSLIASGKYFDVAVRDLVMAIGAFTLANVTSIVERTRDAEALTVRT